jgi:hypothetical protein
VAEDDGKPQAAVLRHDQVFAGKGQTVGRIRLDGENRYRET